jgi:hypothetical protein
MYVLYSTLLHLTPLRLHRVGGCRDRNPGLRHWQSDALTIRLDLIHYPLSNYHIGDTGLNKKKFTEIWILWRLAYPALAGGVVPDEVDMDDLSVLAEYADHVSLSQLVGQAANEHPRRVLKRGKKSTVRDSFWILISSVADPHHFDANPDPAFHF